VAGEVRRLLDHIVERYVVRDEQRAIDLDAAASEAGDAIESDKRAAVRRETDRAESLAAAFHAGLLRAYAADRRGQALVLDDRDPEQNRLADALIQFLVSYELAASHTETVAPMHYTYAITVDWPRLTTLAADAGVDLPLTLAAEAPQRSRESRVASRE